MFRTILKKSVKKQIGFLFLAALTIFGASGQVFAQFTFTGDFDRANFAAPNGYFVEAQNNFPGDPMPNRTAYLFTGELNPDGSIIAGGRIERNGGDFWLRKFTASGAPDTSFGGGTGFVRTIFYGDESMGSNSSSLPSVLKRQADGKIVFGGVCAANAPGIPGFGSDFCLVRYNADGSIDTGFGNNTVLVSNGPNITLSFPVGAGRVITQTNTRDSGLFSGAGLFAQLSDLAIQPDGKIVAVGYTRSETRGANDPSGYRYEGIIIRYNANGSIDSSFGTNGIARFIPANNGTTSVPCYGQREFYGVRLQPDGRIIAVGYDGVGVVNGGCSAGTFFVVTRWTANGQLETVRRLNADTNVFARENAVSAIITNDGGKLLVSGSYQGTEALVRFNLSDLTVDDTFGTNGVVSYIGTGNNRMSIKAIQPDGKILGFDPATNYPVLRLNPNGSPDNSFGNQIFSLFDMNVKGRADLPVFTVNNTAQVAVGHILLRPNGKFNLIGAGFGNFGGPNARALVSQNINSSRNGNYSDFTNDGKSEISVFRPSTGVWH